MQQLYILHDYDHSLKRQGAMPVSHVKAQEMNAEGYGVYHTVNSFIGQRKKSNLNSIRSWYVDIDDLPKPEQLALIESSPLYPSRIVESKNGFHVYFHARDASVATWTEIMARLGHYFNADPNAKDVTRILRTPGFYHHKDPAHPFLIQALWDKAIAYTENMMLYSFKPVPARETVKPQPHREVYMPKGSEVGFWDKVYNFDCLEALSRLSGSASVRYETFTFRRQSNGRQNIYVNGKLTSCFIDENGRIGSSDKGGPTVWQWLKWYGHSNEQIAAILKLELPELWR